MAETVLDDPAATQSLQQFVNQSPWDWRPVRARLAADVHEMVRPAAWIIEHPVIPKRGKHSVGVEPRFVQNEGRTINSQLGTGVIAASSLGCLPTNWRLHLSNRWLEDPNRRERTRIPGGIQARSETDLDLEMLDEMTSEWGLAPAPPVVASARPNDAWALVQGLLNRSMRFLIQVEGDADAVFRGHAMPQRIRHIPEMITRDGRWHGDSQHSPALVGGPRPTARSLAGTGRPGHETTTPSFSQAGASAHHRSSGRNGHHQAGPTAVRLLREQHPAGHLMGRSWVTNLPRTTTRDIMTLNVLRRDSKHAVRQLEEDFGLRDFEGRSFPGWHHHLTLVSAAAIYSMMSGSLADRSA